MSINTPVARHCSLIDQRRKYQSRAQALEDTLSRLNMTAAEHAREETSIREQLSSANREVNQYRSLLGDPSSLATTVQEQGKELDKLRLLQSQSDDVSGLLRF